MPLHAEKLMEFTLSQRAGNFSTKRFGFRENNQNQSLKRKQNGASSALVFYFRIQYK